MKTDRIPRLIEIPKIVDRRGNLSFFENYNHIPFVIERAYWIYDVPGGQSRGGHAFRKQEELIIAISGSFDVIVNNGEEEERFALNRSYYGLYVPAGLWRHMENFSTNSLAFVVASTQFDESDYIHNFNTYKNGICL